MFNPMTEAILVPAIKATNGEGMFFNKSIFCSNRDQENNINKVIWNKGFKNNCQKYKIEHSHFETILIHAPRF